jgi:energy-coupling factor transporter ATP-binding protein EcfA2
MIRIRRHMLDAHSTPYTPGMAQDLVKAALEGGASPAPAAPVAAPAPVVPSAAPAPAPVPAAAAPVASGPLAGMTIAVTGGFTGYTQERVEEILTLAGAKVTDRRNLNRAALLLAGNRAGQVPEQALGMGLEVKDLAWLQSIEASLPASPTPAPVPAAAAAPTAAAPAPAPAAPASTTALVPAPAVSGVRVPAPARVAPSVPVPEAFKSLVIEHDGNPLIGVPTGKYEWMGLDKWLGLMVTQGERVCLVGPAGCGKSQAIVELAALTNHPLIRVNLDGQATTQDLLGKVAARNGATFFEYGALPLAMKNGWWILVDEMDMAEPDVLAVLHAVTEDGGRLVLKENGGEVIVAHPEFRFFATGNSLGLHDEMGIYPGIKPMSAALLDRLVVKLVDHNSESKEARILASKGVPMDVAKLVCGAGTALRKLIADGTITGVWTTRRAIMFAKYAMLTGSYEDAFSIAAEGKFTAPEYKAAWDVCQRITGKVVKGAAASAA